MVAGLIPSPAFARIGAVVGRKGGSRQEFADVNVYRPGRLMCPRARAIVVPYASQMHVFPIPRIVASDCKQGVICYREADFAARTKLEQFV
jgi:hypothetical protein